MVVNLYLCNRVPFTESYVVIVAGLARLFSDATHATRHQTE
jgi:hypothetical protein